jgi:hypothetical protein
MPDIATTQDWWHLLWGIAGLNLLAWLASAAWLHRGETRPWPAQRLQLLLSCVYVLGCGYRSLLPVFDVPRLVLVDSFASSVLVGRSVATLAELSFAAQWALLMRGAALLSGRLAGLWAARAVLPLIAVAELNSWYAVLTTRNLGHVVEESLWGLAALVCVLALALQWHHVGPRLRAGFALAGVAGLAYAAYMFGVDVPMYWSRWLADEAMGKAYHSLAEGLSDASNRWVVSMAWSHWRSEVVWMTAYFSVAVWISIGLAHVRLPAPAFSR